jgi:hypothetical protein
MLPKVEGVVAQNWLARREKLMAIGLSYNVANAKGQGSEPKKKPTLLHLSLKMRRGRQRWLIPAMWMQLLQLERLWILPSELIQTMLLPGLKRHEMRSVLWD